MRTGNIAKNKQKILIKSPGGIDEDKSIIYNVKGHCKNPEYCLCAQDIRHVNGIFSLMSKNV